MVVHILFGLIFYSRGRSIQAKMKINVSPPEIFTITNELLATWLVFRANFPLNTKVALTYVHLTMPIVITFCGLFVGHGFGACLCCSLFPTHPLMHAAVSPTIFPGGTLR
jgi:hypothetical protein